MLSDEDKALGLKNSLPNVDSVEGAPVDKVEEKVEESWYGWISKARDAVSTTTWNTLDMVKRDLSEFGDAVKAETSSIYQTTSSAVKDHVPQVSQIEETGGKLFKGFADTVSTLLALEDTTEGEEKFEVPIKPATLTRSESRLFAIQADPGTYCKEPQGAPELYEDWVDNFNLAHVREEIAHLLANVPEVRNLYKSLVPSTVSDVDFWHRYFYRIHQMKLDELGRKTGLKVEDETEEGLSWGDAAFDEGEEALQKEVDCAATQSSLDSIASPQGVQNEEHDTSASNGWTSGLSTPPSDDFETLNAPVEGT